MKLRNKRLIAILMGILIVLPCSTSFATICNCCKKEAGRDQITDVELHMCDECWSRFQYHSRKCFCQICRVTLDLHRLFNGQDKCWKCDPARCKHEGCSNAIARDDYERMEVYCLQHRLGKCVKCKQLMDRESSELKTFYPDYKFLLGIK